LLIEKLDKLGHFLFKFSFIWPVSCFVLAASLDLLTSNDKLVHNIFNLINLTLIPIIGFISVVIVEFFYYLLQAIITKDWSFFNGVSNNYNVVHNKDWQNNSCERYLIRNSNDDSNSSYVNNYNYSQERNNTNFTPNTVSSFNNDVFRHNSFDHYSGSNSLETMYNPSYNYLPHNIYNSSSND
jgi:hypothetical protein